LMKATVLIRGRGIWLLGICFHARRTGNGQNGTGVGE
jgi:hypothetical protein